MGAAVIVADGPMKLIVVNQSKMETFRRLTEKFVDDLNVRVVWDRRKQQARTRQESHFPERRHTDRRRLKKDWGSRDYFVIHVVEEKKNAGPRYKPASEASGSIS
jgi:hypothetical protein